MAHSLAGARRKNQGEKQSQKKLPAAARGGKCIYIYTFPTAAASGKGWGKHLKNYITRTLQKSCKSLITLNIMLQKRWGIPTLTACPQKVQKGGENRGTADIAFSPHVLALSCRRSVGCVRRFCVRRPACVC